MAIFNAANFENARNLTLTVNFDRNVKRELITCKLLNSGTLKFRTMFSESRLINFLLIIFN